MISTNIFCWWRHNAFPSSYLFIYGCCFNFKFVYYFCWIKYLYSTLAHFKITIFIFRHSIYVIYFDSSFVHGKFVKLLVYGLKKTEDGNKFQDMRKEKEFILKYYTINRFKLNPKCRSNCMFVYNKMFVPSS